MELKQTDHRSYDEAQEQFLKMVDLYPEEHWSLILSEGKYYVENGTPLIRTWETLLDSYDGKK